MAGDSRPRIDLPWAALVWETTEPATEGIRISEDCYKSGRLKCGSIERPSSSSSFMTVLVEDRAGFTQPVREMEFLVEDQRVGEDFSKHSYARGRKDSRK